MSGSEELMQMEEVEGQEGQEEYEAEGDDAELAQMQKELAKAEQQKAELDKMNKQQGSGSAGSADGKSGGEEAEASAADQAERDSRSIFIGNVDFAASVEEVRLAKAAPAPQWPDPAQVQALFADCGEINAITIPVDKFTGRAKGFAYLEFADKAGVGAHGDGEEQRAAAGPRDQGCQQENQPPGMAGDAAGGRSLSYLLIVAPTGPAIARERERAGARIPGSSWSRRLQRGIPRLRQRSLPSLLRQQEEPEKQQERAWEDEHDDEDNVASPENFDLKSSAALNVVGRETYREEVKEVTNFDELLST
eukprot:761649-Hanusia_phi.AAC.4